MRGCMDDWDDVRFLLAALREGSLTAAARSLGVRQSTVSRRIAGLERRLGVRLFERTPEGLVPTELAQAWRPMAEVMEQQAGLMGAEAAGWEAGPRGVVRIAATESLAMYVLVPELARWRSLYPELEVELLVGYGFADMLRREADLALRFERPVQGELVVKRVARMPQIILGTQALAGRAWSELEWVRFFLPGMVTPEERWMREQMARGPVMSTTSYLSQVEAVRRGVGVGLMSSKIARVAPELTQIEAPVPLPPDQELWLVGHRSMRRVPRVEVMWRELEALAMRELAE